MTRFLQMTLRANCIGMRDTRLNFIATSNTPNEPLIFRTFDILLIWLYKQNTGLRDIHTWENNLEQNPDARQAMIPSGHTLDHNNEEHDYYASGADLGVQTPSWGHSPLQASDSRRHYCVNVSLQQKNFFYNNSS